MSAENVTETAANTTPAVHRWMVPMDFSLQANAAFEWVLSIMKPEDYFLVLNVLNLKAPTYAHDIALNERMKRESQEKLDAMNKQVKEKGFPNVVCNYAIEKKIDTIVMGRRGMTNMERVLNGSVSTYVLSNAPCAVCLMGKGVEDRIVKEQLKQQDKEMQEVISASSSEAENDGEKKMPFFLPRKHSEKNYYTDSD
ncbi:hypothetical protein BLSTO_04534 [Blastocystis sp. subtype 1]